MIRQLLCATLSLTVSLLALTPAAAQLNFGGLQHAPLGNASLQSSPQGGLIVSNIGSSGEDGVSVDLNGADGAFFRVDELEAFGADSGDMVMNPMATGVPGIALPPSVTLTKLGPLSYSIAVDTNANAQGGGTVGDGGDVFLDFFDADGGVTNTLPITSAGVVGDFDFSGGGLGALSAIESRDVLKTYFETGDVPTEAGFTGSGGTTIPGVFGFQLRYPRTDLTNAEVRYAAPGNSQPRSISQTFGQKLGGFAAGIEGGVILSGLGDAQLGAGDQLIVSNIGSSGQDGVRINFGEPDLRGGELAGVEVEKFQMREAYGQVQQQAKQAYGGGGSPTYTGQSGTGQNVLYEGSIEGNSSGGIDGFFEIDALGTDSYQLRISQDGNPLVNEVVIGIRDKSLAFTLNGQFPSTELLTTLTPDALLWDLDAAPASVTTASGATAQLNPGLPLQIELRPVGASSPASGLGSVRLLYADLPGGAVISGVSIPEPGAAALWSLAVFMGFRVRWLK